MPLMKTLRYPFFFALIFSMQTVLSAQGRVFDWSRPSPSGQIMLGVASFGDGTFVLVGEQGDYLRTTDGGDSWHRYQTGLSRILRGVDAAGDVGIICGDGGAVHKTTDRGLTWTHRWAPTSSRNLRDVSVLSADHIVAVGGNLSNEGVIVRSTDGGETWDIYEPEVPVNLYSVSFVDSLHGWACGWIGTILKTVDGGESWSIHTPSVFQHIGLHTIEFFDTLHGFAAGTSGRLAFTRDGGETWVEPTGRSLGGVIEGGAIIDDSTAIFSGKGHFGIYSKQGEEILVTHRGPRSAYAIAFDRQTGTGLLSRPFTGIERSIDAGRTWTKVLRGTMSGFSIQDLAFVDSSHGIGIDVGGGVIRTTDGGKSWGGGSITLKPGETDKELSSVAFAEPSVALLARSEGDIYRSADSGATWSRIFDTDYHLYEVTFADRQHGFISASSGVLRTTDAGKSWIEDRDSFSDPLYAIDAPDPQNIFVAGYNGLLARSTDSGKSWQPIETDFTVDFFMISADGNGAITAGWRGGLVRSTDDGKTWVSNDAPDGSQLLGFSFLTPTTGWCGQRDRPMLSTTDGGESWQSYDPDYQYYLDAPCLISPGYGFVGGTHGHVFAVRLPGDGVGVRNDVAAEPTVPTLRIVPNPTTDRCAVMIGTEPATRIRVYDLLGREIAIDADAHYLSVRLLPAGSYVIRASDTRGDYNGTGFLRVEEN